MDRGSKTPRKGGGRFNTIATSTPSKGMPLQAVKRPQKLSDPSEAEAVKPLAIARNETSMASGHCVQTPKRGGALFNNSSPMIEHKDSGSSTIKVFVRVRPMSSSEKSTGRTENIVSVPTTDTVVLQGSEPKPFTFDYVADSTTTQNEVFDMIGRPFTDSCLKGYNGCIFAYGQTGSGKTFTMQGPEADVIDTESTQRGLIPRTFEYLFERIAQKEATANAASPGSLQFTVRCSYMEIYNETVTDLLDPSKCNLAVRENHKDGIYVDGISWQEVRNAEGCVSLLHKGLRNRKVGETSMNKESSRSHSLLTLKVESTLVAANGITKQRHSCLNLVDLAGSERQKSTNASGDRLKEASNINRSLSALGNVIMALADMSDGKARHVHYRDSKLTFLLKDSLGGNSKTAIISNISPADSNFGETLSTLKFAQRAKLIKTRAILNEDTNGSMDQLRAEIKDTNGSMDQLRAEIKRLKAEVAASKGAGGEVILSRPSMNASWARESSGAGFCGTAACAPAEEVLLRERISALENLLYQSMETQAEAEHRCLQLVETSSQSLQRCEMALNADNELFSSLKMQLKLKTESIKHLASKAASKGGGSSEAATQLDGGRVAELEREVHDLRSENTELRRAQDAPLGQHPDYRGLALERDRLLLAMRSQGAFVVESSTVGVNGETIKLHPHANMEERRHMDEMTRQVRDQFMHAVKDKKALIEEVAALRALVGNGGGGSSSRRFSGALGPVSVSSVMSPSSQASLAAMTTPQRKTFECVRLQMWREEQDFDAKRKRLEEELDTTKREVTALQMQLSSATRRADFAEMELEELRPSLRRLSVGFDRDCRDTGDAAAEIERIAKRAAEARMSCQTEKLSRQAAEAALSNACKLAAELKAAQQEVEEAHKREGTLRHQLEAAEYAVAASERRANKQQRSSLSADPTRLAQLAEENEQLQLRLSHLQDEYESRKEEFAFMEGKVERVSREFAQQEEQVRAQALALDASKAKLTLAEQRVAGLEKRLENSGDQAQAALALSLREAENRQADLARRLDESTKNEDELRDGLAHQQAVHEALQKETAIAQEVLRETLQSLENKSLFLEQLQAELNDKSSEVKELSDKLDATLSDLDHSNTAKEDMRRRHEALIDDRESVERDHQAQMDEMMAELKKRQERICEIEKRASKAEKRLSNLEEESSDAAKLRAENETLQSQLSGKENEVFEINFEVKGMTSKLKLLETERDELQASLGEVAHVRDELQTKCDKLAKQLGEGQEELEAVQEESARLMADLSHAREHAQELEGARAGCEQREQQSAQLAAAAMQRAEAAEAAARAVEQEKLQQDTSARAGGGDGGQAEAEELAALRGQMEAWLHDMRLLKEQEEAATQDAALKGKMWSEAQAARELAEAALAEAHKQVDELNAINTKLIGHSNAKQKVQHVVKMKEENNELHASLRKSQGDLAKVKDKAARLEKEVDKLRAALGVEGGADEVLAEEERSRSILTAKEEEYKLLIRHMDDMLAKALAAAPQLGGAGEAKALCSAGEADASVCERVARVLDALVKRVQDDADAMHQQQAALKNREFENELLKKQAQLRGAPPVCAAVRAGDENKHPNSPSSARLALR